PFPQVADVVVLAIDALQVAVGEEDGAAAAPPHQRPLLPEVGTVTGDHGERPHLADPFRPGRAVDVAVPGAEGAVRKNLPGGFDPLGKLTASMETDVTRLN